MGLFEKFKSLLGKQNKTEPTKIITEAIDKEEYLAAINLLSEDIVKEPKSNIPYYQRGLAYDKLNLFDKAIDDFTMSIKLEDKFSNAFYGRGIVYQKLQDLTNALSDFNAALKLDPHNTRVYCSRGDVLQEMGNWKEAMSDYNSACNIGKFWFVDAFKQRGRLNYKLEKFQKAVTDFNSAINLNSNDTETLVGLGMSYVKLGNLDEGKKHLKTAYKLGEPLAKELLSKLES